MLAAPSYFRKLPITVTLAGGTDATVNSDAELQSNNASLTTQATITQAEENSKKLETILVDGSFKVQSFITAGVDSANNYKDSTVDFANDWTVKAVTTLTTTAAGTYAVSSELDVFLN
jgi:hypothetical protein